jgi:hypothetical protein
MPRYVSSLMTLGTHSYVHLPNPLCAKHDRRFSRRSSEGSSNFEQHHLNVGSAALAADQARRRAEIARELEEDLVVVSHKFARRAPSARTDSAEASNLTVNFHDERGAVLETHSLSDFPERANVAFYQGGGGLVAGVRRVVELCAYCPRLSREILCRLAHRKADISDSQANSEYHAWLVAQMEDVLVKLEAPMQRNGASSSEFRL